MFIILAAPNSASTSLLYTINKHTNYHCYQVFHYPTHNTLIRKRGVSFFLKKLKIFSLFKSYFFHLIDKHFIFNKLFFTSPAKDFELLSNFHSDICDFDNRLFTAFHYNIFDKEKIILKQHFPPTDNNIKFFKNFKKIILIRDTNNILNKYRTKKYLHLNINEDKLRIELDTWKKKWMLEKNTLIVQFDELISNPYKQLKLIEEYTGIEFNISEKFELPYLNRTKK